MSALVVEGLVRRFGAHTALAGVSLEVPPGGLHALIGPNGAGKTTLLRTVTGLLAPDEGSVRVAGVDTRDDPSGVRRLLGFVPSGDRTFYLRLSGTENLVFFGRLYGLSRAVALGRAAEVLELVGLADAARRQVGLYSHGMAKRLSMARALLVEPRVLLVDEATHDLDPESAARVRGLVRGVADRGVAVLWTTQRLEELHGFAQRVTVLARGEQRFSGTVPELAARSRVRSYVLRLPGAQEDDVERWSAALGSAAVLQTAPELGSPHVRLVLAPETTLGDALARLVQHGAVVDGCAEEQSTIEAAFLSVTSLVQDAGGAVVTP